MNSYYQSLFKELQTKMEEEKYQEAYDLIHQEISVPYVPQDCLDRLMEYKENCRPYLKEKTKSPSIEQVFSWIDDPLKQDLAIPFLKTVNLRQYPKEVQSLLNKDLLPEVKGELIEYLMEQKIDLPFQVEKEGWEITFIPSAILDEHSDPTVQEVLALFDRWFSNEDPAFQNFCITLFHQEILSRRPFDFSEEEALPIAISIVRLVYNAFTRDDEFEIFIQNHELSQVPNAVLYIERRGE